MKPVITVRSTSSDSAARHMAKKQRIEAEAVAVCDRALKAEQNREAARLEQLAARRASRAA